MAMGLRKLFTLVAVASACALAAAPALARPFAGGLYTGTVRQAVPHAYAGKISFTVRGHRLTKLQFNVTMVCSRALIAQVQAPANKLKISVQRTGKFSYAGVVHGTRLKLQGTIRGHRASGTFFESFQTAPGHRCSMVTPAPFQTQV